jgi:hypothetical protein
MNSNIDDFSDIDNLKKKQGIIDTIKSKYFKPK